MKKILHHFQIHDRGSSVGRELLGGITTFFAMAYLLAVIPRILSQTGMEFSAVMTATCLAAAAGSIATGVFANLPFAQAPGLGFQTIFTLTLCSRYGYSWQQALAVVFLSGLLFLIISLTPLRERIMDAIPMPFKFALSAGIGLLITLSGLINAGLVTAEDNLLDMGDITGTIPLLALLGIFLTAGLMIYKVKGALIIGMAAITLLGIPFGITRIPPDFNMLQGVGAVAFKLDFKGLATHGMIPLVSSILTLTLCDFFDTVGTLLGVGGDAKMTDNTGDLPKGGHAIVCDAAATCAGALLGVSNTTTVAESATGIQEGARTGLAAVVTGVMFLAAIPLAPFIRAIPGAATTAAMVIVGMMMMSGITQIHWKHVEVSLPCFLIIVGMPFTSSITTGISLGILSYVVLMVMRKRAHLVSPYLYVLAGIFFVMYILAAL